MKLTRHGLVLVLLWLLLSGLLVLLLSEASERQVNESIEDKLHNHLLLSLDESLFSNAENRVNDQDSIVYVGTRINQALQTLVRVNWYAPSNSCEVELQSLDGIQVASKLSRGIVFSLPRNQIDREVIVGISCSRNWWPLVLCATVLGCFFLGIHRLFPPPLAAAHRRWINYLLAQGYSGQRAFELVNSYDVKSLIFNACQMRVVEQFHDSERQNFEQLIEVVMDPRVVCLDESEMKWLSLCFASEGLENLARALEIAKAPDLVEIDLSKSLLRVHGLPIPSSKTPLLYYAWYAKQRQLGEGWLINPASNRPDMQEGARLAEFMWQYGGHAKAISDLEQFGLKAKTLDQNRSKIKDEMIAVLGEELASLYLFYPEKHTDGSRMRYRLRVDSAQVRFI